MRLQGLKERRSKEKKKNEKERILTEPDKGLLDYITRTPLLIPSMSCP